MAEKFVVIPLHTTQMETLKIKAFDASQHLTTPSLQRRYLERCIKENI